MSNELDLKLKQASKANDTVEVLRLVTDLNVDPSIFLNFSLRQACWFNNVEIFEFLLNDEQVNPTTENNSCISYAFNNGLIEILNLLWKHPKVKDTLQQDHIDIYNIMTRNDIKFSIKEF